MIRWNKFRVQSSSKRCHQLGNLIGEQYADLNQETYMRQMTTLKLRIQHIRFSHYDAFILSDKDSYLSIFNAIKNVSKIIMSIKQ